MSDFCMDEFEAIARSAPPSIPAPVVTYTPAEIEAARLRAEIQRREQRKRDIARAHAEWLAEYPRISGVPKTFRNKVLDDLEEVTDEQRAAVDACWEFIGSWQERMRAGQPSSLWLLGDTGTGKTRIASALVTVLHIEIGVSARLVKTRALISRLRDTWHGGRRLEHQADVLSELTGVEVLVLDDVGADTCGTPNEQQLLFEVIDRRCEEGHPTLLTSNEDPEGLLHVLGKRSYDRLKHGVRVIPLTEKSYRQPMPAAAVPA